MQRLSLARTVGEVQEIVRTAARRLCGADGAVLVMRDGPMSWYVDEDAVAPLWKGQRFPLDSCLGGWVIRHGVAAVIPDVSDDPRVPFAVYEPTFARSCVVVPIRRQEAIGAIGNYWSTNHHATPEEIELLQALADATAVALENVALWSDSERRIAERTAVLEASLAQTEETLNTLAHELRNAIGSARGLLELALADQTLDPETREDVRLAHAGTAEGLVVLEQQLAIARDQAGQLTPEHERVPVCTVLDDLARTYRAIRDDGSVALRVDRPGAGLELRTDPHLLTQVLRNLISNALKFTDTGEVRLGACAGPGPKQVTLSVADTGVGIAPDDQARIFERFEQVDHVQAGRPLGTGLGLPYVLQVTRLLGGTLALDSEPGVGSTFSLTLPRA
ncbi:MAG: GAF domain-containing sensor histidine kinase [Patulibacter minatonensis]